MVNWRCDGLSNQRHIADRRSVDANARFGGGRSQCATTGKGLQEPVAVEISISSLNTGIGLIADVEICDLHCTNQPFGSAYYLRLKSPWRLNV